MISQKIAQRLNDECIEIENCEKALALFKQRRNKPAIPGCVINVYLNEDEEGENVFLLPGIAKKAIAEQLAILKEQYIDLNKIAAQELKLK